jgi:copper chaperone CopZ
MDGAAAVRTIELDISGMTCAACSARVEKVLGKRPGVAAARVNLATERAHVDVAGDATSLDDLIAAVRKAGFDAAEHRPGSIRVPGRACAPGPATWTCWWPWAPRPRICSASGGC